MENPTVSVVVPVYNEEAVIMETHRRLLEVLEGLKESFEVIYVNDGSRDSTMSCLKNICTGDGRFKAIDLSRNFGHQTAITAGMSESSGDAVVIIDADLQDPPELIGEMLKKWREGFDVVYGRRTKRMGETRFKKATASLFYRFLNMMTNIKLPVDSGDFRLIDRRICDLLCDMPEHNRYVRGLIAWLGFKQTEVRYVRDARFAGETKYPFSKMLKLCFDAVFSFSYKPLCLAMPFAAVTAVVSLIFIVLGAAVHDGELWLFAGVLLLFLAGVLLSIGIIGGYIGRIYEELKARPLFIIRERIGFKGTGEGERN